MTSNVDPTFPTEGNAYTADVRRQFATAATEITSLQDAVAALQAAVAQLQDRLKELPK
jgi:uncharacterized coiled-coil protein SlyX